jgi:acylphosphatase
MVAMKWRRSSSTDQSSGRAIEQEQMAGTRDTAHPDAPGGEQATGTVRMTAWVAGYVQGVGFRWWTRSRALELGLVGTATNLYDGRVEVVVEGPKEACEALLGQLRGANAPGGVDTVTYRLSDARGTFRGFNER